MQQCKTQELVLRANLFYSFFPSHISKEIPWRMFLFQLVQTAVARTHTNTVVLISWLQLQRIGPCQMKHFPRRIWVWRNQVRASPLGWAGLDQQGITRSAAVINGCSWNIGVGKRFFTCIQIWGQFLVFCKRVLYNKLFWDLCVWALHRNSLLIHWSLQN